MFCTACGNELKEGDKFCRMCGKRIREVELFSGDESKSMDIRHVQQAEVPIQTEDNKTYEKSEMNYSVVKNSKKEKKTACRRKILKGVLLIFLIIAAISGMVLMRDKSNEAEINTTVILGKIMEAKTDFGTRDFGEVRRIQMTGKIFAYCDSFHGYFSWIGSTIGKRFTNVTRAEKNIEKVKELKEDYYNDENENGELASILLLALDGLTREDIMELWPDNYCDREMLYSDFQEFLRKNMRASILYEETDVIICANLFIRTAMATDGYLDMYCTVDELKAFVFDEMGVPTLSEECLREQPSYNMLVADLENSFVGEKVYYSNLSGVGKIIFLYFTCIQINQKYPEVASELWNYYFYGSYIHEWNMLLDNSKLEGIFY